MDTPREGTVGRLRLTLTASLVAVHAGLAGQDTSAVTVHGDSVSLRFVEADLRMVVQAIGRLLDRPLLAPQLPAVRVTLETPAPIARGTLAGLLAGLAETHELTLEAESTFYRLVPRVSRRVSAAPQEAPLELFVIRLRHARAADVAALLSQLFGGLGEFTGRAGQLGQRGLTEELRQARVPPGEPVAPAGQGPPSAQAVGAELGGPVTVVPDEFTNTLLVRASAADFEVIRQAVDQVDVRPLQVLIQVLIVEARRDHAFSLGTDLVLPPQSVGPGDATVEATLAGGGRDDLIVGLMKLGTAQLDVVIRAAEARGHAKIISRPVLLASNGQEARILVGSQRPFVQVSRSLPTDTPTRDQVVQYKDVGTKLTVIPTINADGYVSLEILQEVSTATAEVQFDAPVIATRETATQLLVKDGQTAILGGMRDVLQEVTSSGIPLLSSIPIVGGLFGAQDRRRSEAELFVFLTPTVLRDDAAVDEAAARAMGEAERAGALRRERKP